MQVSGHRNNCIMIIGWPIFRLERYFLGRERNFLLHFARKSLHHHSIILVISDKHTHTGLMCRNTNHSRVRQTCRLSPLCYVHFSSIALVFVFSIVQNWTCCDYPLPAWPFSLQENGERMRKWRVNGERMRKWREIHSLDFLIFSLFPPFLSISYIKNCNILSQNVKDRLLSRMSQKA